MLINRLKNTFSTLVEEFARKYDAMYVEKDENKIYISYSIVLKILRIEFVYVKKSILLCPKSSIFTRIYFNKNATFFYHIPEIIDKLDPTDFKCYYFSSIETEERMIDCFKCLDDFYERNMPKLKAFSMDTSIQNELENRKKEEIKRLWKIDEDIQNISFDDEMVLWNEIVIEHESSFCLFRYMVYTGYMEYLRGNIDNAIKYYNKFAEKDGLMEYEKRLYEFLSSEKSEGYEAISPECMSGIEVDNYKGNKEDNKAFAKSVFICYLLISILFSIVFIIENAILKGDALYIAGMPMWCVWIYAGLPAVFGAIAFRRKLYFITRKDAKKALAYDELLNGKKANILINVVFIITFVAGFLFVIWFQLGSLKFYDDYFIYVDDEDENFIIEKTTIKYDEIDKIYYFKGRYNDFGDYIKRPSYILVLKDKKEIDFDFFISVKET